MMEAMLGMKQLMESSAATVAAASTTTEVDPALSTAAHHPVPNMMGQERSTLGHISNPHLGYNRGAYPYGLPPNYTPPAMHEDVGHINTLLENSLHLWTDSLVFFFAKFNRIIFRR